MKLYYYDLEDGELNWCDLSGAITVRTKSASKNTGLYSWSITGWAHLHQLTIF